MTSSDDDGRDLIFASGAPGSGWTGLCRTLYWSPEVNKSDLRITRMYVSGLDKKIREFDGYERTPKGQSRSIHFGNYFGPGLGFGENFDRLDTLSKKEILSELERPYLDFNEGKKILKSHYFLRFSSFILDLFPEASILFVYREGQESAERWRGIGGFDITYPDYHAYAPDEDFDETVRKDAEIIRTEIDSHQLKQCHYRELLECLKLSLPVDLDTPQFRIEDHISGSRLKMVLGGKPLTYERVLGRLTRRFDNRQVYVLNRETRAQDTGAS